jgi:hypothetical protein
LLLLLLRLLLLGLLALLVLLLLLLPLVSHAGGLGGGGVAGWHQWALQMAAQRSTVDCTFWRRNDQCSAWNNTMFLSVPAWGWASMAVQGKCMPVLRNLACFVIRQNRHVLTANGCQVQWRWIRCMHTHRLRREAGASAWHGRQRGAVCAARDAAVAQRAVAGHLHHHSTRT